MDIRELFGLSAVIMNKGDIMDLLLGIHGVGVCPELDPTNSDQIPVLVQEHLLLRIGPPENWPFMVDLQKPQTKRFLILVEEPWHPCDVCKGENPGADPNVATTLFCDVGGYTRVFTCNDHLTEGKAKCQAMATKEATIREIHLP